MLVPAASQVLGTPGPVPYKPEAFVAFVGVSIPSLGLQKSLGPAISQFAESPLGAADI